MPEVRILSLDGGGIRGVIPATVLAYLEDRLDRPIGEVFHLVAGTSTGGILAAGLAPRRSGAAMTAAELVALYRDRGGEIFDRSFWHGFGSLGGLSDEKYPAGPLEGILTEKLGDLRLADLARELLVTAYDIERRSPHFFKSWRARGTGADRPAGENAATRDFFLRDVCRATSAAPTYFQPALASSRGGTRHALIDGGVFANNPAMCAVASAMKIYAGQGQGRGQGRVRPFVVSLGTGLTERPIPYDEAKDWGLLAWARPALAVMFDGVSDTVGYELDQLLGRDHKRFDIALGADPADPAAPNDDMDDARPENIARLIDRAEALIAANRSRLDLVVRRLKREMVPLTV
ncbi:MAG: patatin [Alphaproteobacteria bacterium]|jgi:hypothetical protein|nr:patatin [Alphaproteobacteria bacterium]